MITVEEMKDLEHFAVKHGVPGHDLMENAGEGAVQILKEARDLSGKKVLVVCYHGNNGGDGFVCARHLLSLCSVTVLFLGDKNKLKHSAKTMFDILPSDIIVTQQETIAFSSFDIIVDALFGTGLRGMLRPYIASVIENINKSKAFIVSLDIPSGIDPSTGEKSISTVVAQLVIAFHDTKIGCAEYIDKTKIVDIGIPKK